MFIAITLSSIIALAMTIWLTGVYKDAAIKRGIIDHPDHRSSHTTPTPTGGGIVAVIFIMCLWVVSYFAGLITLKEKIALILPGALIAAVGFLDDRKHLAKRWRFGAQIVAVAVVIALLYPLPGLPIWEGLELDPNGWALPLVALAMLWLINLYNFMDGIDGLAGAEAVTVLGGIALVLMLAGNAEFAILLAITAIPILGFLVWNWPPAKIFMGDACSTFLGLSFGTLALITSKDAQITPWVWVIMLSAFWVDATYTLVVRMVTGQDWRSPHRTHLYQKLALKKSCHCTATSIAISVASLWLLPVSVIVTSYLSVIPLSTTLAAISPILICCFYFGAGRATSR